MSLSEVVCVCIKLFKSLGQQTKKANPGQQPYVGARNHGKLMTSSYMACKTLQYSIIWILVCVFDIWVCV